MLHIWQPWWKFMEIFGSITRQYFQKCKLAWVLTSFFRKMTIKWWSNRFVSKKTKTRNFWQPCCSNRLENAKNETFGQQYVGVDTNIVRFCWLRAVREKESIFLNGPEIFVIVSKNVLAMYADLPQSLVTWAGMQRVVEKN